MADLFTMESTADVAGGAAGSRLGTALDTGVLRRRYRNGLNVVSCRLDLAILGRPSRTRSAY